MSLIRFSKPVAMKNKERACVKSVEQEPQSLSSTEPEFYLPDDCWEHVFTFIINPVDGTEDKNKLNFKSLSLVSKHFLFITNRLVFSLTIYNPPLCFLPRFFHRFSYLNSLHLWFNSREPDAAAVALALHHRPTLKSLSISGMELKEANYANYVTSHYIDSFLSLNSLKFACSHISISDDLLYSIAREGHPIKSFVLENCNGYSYHGIYDLLSKCHGIQHLGLQGVDFLNNHHVSQLSLLLPDLVSINLSQCSKLTTSALFALINNCHSLGEIRMDQIFTEVSEENSISLKDFDVNPRLKVLYLCANSFKNDDTVLLFASIFSNLQLLDLRFCGISKNGIYQVLRRCCKLRHLILAGSNEVRGLKMDFIVHQLEVLDLSITNVDDKTLYEISKSCCGLLELSLEFCDITEKGVMHVVENCTQLKEIVLIGCDKVNADVVDSMFSSRPLNRNNRSTSFLFDEEKILIC